MDLAQLAGVPFEQVRQAADLIRERKKIIICWAMGLTQHKNAVGNIRELVNLLLLKGSIGKPGAGTCPVRGHSNVQGDRTMGIWEAPPPAFLDRLEKVFDFKPPRRHGYNTVRAIQAMADGLIQVFFGLGGNFLSATPDTRFTASALRRCNLTVHVSTKLNRSHLITGRTALILPCLARTDTDRQAAGPQFQTVENSMGIVHATRGRLAPPSPHLLSEVDIVCRLAAATLPPSSVDWHSLRDDYDRIRNLIELSIPGFERFNERARYPAGFYLPNAARDGLFRTDTGKAQFTLNPPARLSLQPGELVMMTIRSHDQFNTTIYGLNDRYRGIRNGRRIIFLHPEDIRELGWADGDMVDLVSRYDGVLRTAPHFRIVSYDIPRRCAATYFPEANPLIPIHAFADKSETPVSKSVVISLRPCSDPPGGLAPS
jgi:molybdopterin-dependent oxidoreductase alpha subunit